MLMFLTLLPDGGTPEHAIMVPSFLRTASYKSIVSEVLQHRWGRPITEEKVAPMESIITSTELGGIVLVGLTFV